MAIAIAMLIGFFCTATFAQPNKPIQWLLKVTPKSFSKGDQFTARLTAQIAKGWHLYSLEEVPNGPRPTRITIAANQPFEIASEILAPVPITRFDENFGVETQFYEKAVTFKLPIKITSSAKSGNTKLIVQTRYQVCNEELCLPPKTIKVEITIKIK